MEPYRRARSVHDLSRPVGVWLAVFAAIGFSFKAILVKLAYPYGVDAISLLALRMLFSLPVSAMQLSGAALVIAGVLLVANRRP
jgi:drug/metabolite transporter (DMT)-like permease